MVVVEGRVEVVKAVGRKGEKADAEAANNKATVSFMRLLLLLL